jgi:hypothetical protein
MKTINFKGKGEHSVNELELIIEQQAEELHLIKSGQKQLILSGVSGGLTGKEAIDYEIRAKRKDKEENLKGWVYAMFFTFMLFVSLFAMIKSCSS